MRFRNSGATGGTMRRTFERAATAIAMAAVLAGASGCSAVKKSNRVSAATSSPVVVPSPPAGTTSSGQVTQAAFNEDGDGARIVLSADAPLLYQSYEPPPDPLL